MAGCILRVSGENLDIELWRALAHIEPAAVFRKGEPRSPSRPGTRKYGDNGINFVVSDSEDFAEQVTDAELYLHSNKASLAALVERADHEAFSLNFGVFYVYGKDFVKTMRIPAGLSTIAGELGIELAVTVYPMADQDDGEIS